MYDNIPIIPVTDEELERVLVTLGEPHKLYVLVREDLPPGLRAAQAGHAVAEVCLSYKMRQAPTWNRDGNFLIVLGVPDEQALKEAYFDLWESGVQTGVVWREPDLDNAWTSVAFLPEPEQNNFFARYRLAYAKPKGLRGRLINLLGW